MLYAIIETLSQVDFEVHHYGCPYGNRHGQPYMISGVSPQDAADKFMATHYNDLDRELGFGQYKVMPCAKS